MPVAYKERKAVMLYKPKTEIIIVILLMAIFFSACTESPKEKKQPAMTKVLFYWNPWPGLLPYIVAHEKGFFKDEGIDFQIEFTDEYTKMIRDIESGKGDVFSIVYIDALESVQRGNSLRMGAVTDYSNGADGIVALKDITSIKELKGKKTAVEKGTLGEYLLYAALERNGMSFKDIQVVDMSAQKAAEAFAAGKMDAAVTYEPDLSSAVTKGKGRLLFTSADAPLLIVTCMGLRKDFMEKNPDTVKALLRAYFRAVEYIKVNPKEAYATGGKYFKISPADFEAQIAGIRLMDLRDNITAFSHAAGMESLYGNGRYALGYLKKMGKPVDKINIEEVVDGRFVKEIGK
jgi:NitT/TauT family transport system substrate-binding protein